ncbi:MAG: hypothetical protein WCJ02_09470 [bacterium]
MKKFVFAAIGAVLGAFIGFAVVAGVAYYFMSVMQNPREWIAPSSMGFGMIVGVPVGVIVFCIIGFKFGANMSK